MTTDFWKSFSKLARKQGLYICSNQAVNFKDNHLKTFIDWMSILDNPMTFKGPKESSRHEDAGPSCSCRM